MRLYLTFNTDENHNENPHADEHLQVFLDVASGAHSSSMNMWDLLREDVLSVVSGFFCGFFVVFFLSLLSDCV